MLTPKVIVLTRSLTSTVIRSIPQNVLSKKRFATSSDPHTKISFEVRKQKFSNMSLEGKSSFHKSGKLTVDQIPTWVEYWNEHKSRIAKSLETVEKVDEELAKKVSLWCGDITILEIDAIVNAANSSLMGGGGVDGAIHRAAGPNLKTECFALKGCKVGEAKITKGYMLPAKYIIHTVGPQGENPQKLKECYEFTMSLATRNRCRTIAFPCISTGVYGYPQKPAANVAISTVKQFLIDNRENMDRVIFCVFLDSDKEIYEELLQKYFALD